MANLANFKKYSSLCILLSFNLNTFLWEGKGDYDQGLQQISDSQAGAELRGGPYQLHWVFRKVEPRPCCHRPTWTPTTLHKSPLEILRILFSSQSSFVEIGEKYLDIFFPKKKQFSPTSQCNKLLPNPKCSLLQTIRDDLSTVSCVSDREGEKELMEERRGREGRGELVHNYSRDLWPEKQFINHIAWDNVIQIALHAAAILVCVKLHNNTDWRTFWGWGWWDGKRLELLVGADERGLWLTNFGGVMDKKVWESFIYVVWNFAEVQNKIVDLETECPCVNLTIWLFTCK